MIGASEPKSPEVGIEMVICALNMMEPAPTTSVLAALDERSSQALGFILERSSAINSESAIGEGMAPKFELEIGFDRNLVLEESALTEKGELTDPMGPLGPWIASMLVRSSDQHLKYFPDSSE